MQRAVPQHDIVLLAASEIAEGKWVFRRANHAQVGLDAGAQTDACFGRPARHHALDERMRDKKLRHLLRRFGSDDKIQVAHNFFPAPVTSGDAYVHRGGILPQIVLQLFGLCRDRAQLEAANMFRSIRDRQDQLILRRFSKARQFRDASGGASLRQIRKGTDL